MTPKKRKASAKKRKPKEGTRAISWPTVFTPEVLQKLEEAFKIDATIREACAYAGISESIYYEHCQKDPAFSERMDRAQQFAFMLAKKTVIEAFRQVDGKLALKWLQNRQRDRYHEKQETTVKVEKDGAAELAEAMLGADGFNEPPIGTRVC